MIKLPGFMKKYDNMAKTAAIGVSIKKINEIIKELKKIVKERNNYKNTKYWDSFNYIFFDSPQDRENLKQIIKAIKTKKYCPAHTRYLKKLIQYIIDSKNKKFLNWIQTGETQESIIKKTNKIKKMVEKTTIPKGINKKFEKKAKKILKKEGVV